MRRRDLLGRLVTKVPGGKREGIKLTCFVGAARERIIFPILFKLNETCDHAVSFRLLLEPDGIPFRFRNKRKTVNTIMFHSI